MNLVRSAYHGGDFEGNQCKGFLECLDKLKINLPPAMSPFLYCLEQLSHLLSGCYGEKLSPNYKDLIQDFSLSFGALGMGLVLESSQNRLQKVSTMIERSLSGTKDTKIQKPIQTTQTN